MVLKKEKHAELLSAGIGSFNTPYRLYRTASSLGQRLNSLSRALILYIGVDFLKWRPKDA